MKIVELISETKIVTVKPVGSYYKSTADHNLQLCYTQRVLGLNSTHQRIEEYSGTRASAPHSGTAAQRLSRLESRSDRNAAVKMSRRVISDLSRVGAQYSIVRNFQFSTARNHHYKLEVSGRIVRYKDEGKDKYETATKDDKAGQNFWDGTFPTDYEDKFFRHMASTTAKDDDAGSRQCFGDRMFHKCSCCDKAGQSFWDRIFPTDFDKIFRDFDKIFLDKASTTAKDNDAGSRQCFGDRMFHKCSCCDKDDEDNEDRSFQCSGDIMIKFGQCSCCDKVEYDEDGSRQCFGDRVFDQCSCCDKDKARTAANKYDN